MYDSTEAVLSGASKLLPLIELIYDAVEDASLWQRVMALVGEAVRADLSVLPPNFSQSAIPQKTTACTGGDPSIPASHAGHHAPGSMVAQQSERRLEPGKIISSRRGISSQELEKSELPDDCFQLNWLYHSFGMKVLLETQEAASIPSTQPLSNYAFGKEEEIVLRILLPHLRRALKLRLQFLELRSNVHGLESALAAFDLVVFGLDGSGTCVFENRAAQELLRAGDGVGLASGRLAADDASEDAELQLLIAETVAGIHRGHSSGGALIVRRRSGKPALRVTIAPFTSNPIPNRRQIAALVFVSDPAKTPGGRGPVLRLLYRLSPSEARLADLLAAGCDIITAADRMGLTTETARFHVKSIFRKTGTNRQADLVRLVLSIPGEASGSPIERFGQSKAGSPLCPSGGA